MGHPGPLEDVRRQVGAVRRRTNLRAVQHAVALWIACGALAAAAVILAALRGRSLAFALVAAAGVLALLAATWALARRTRREWLRASDAPARIDAARGLRGRVASAIELDGRAGGDLFALLVRQNAEALPRWRPEDVVPEVVPGRAFGAAVAALALLAAVIALAPQLRRPPPRVLLSDRTIDFLASSDAGPADADRLLLAPGTGHEEPGDTSAVEGLAAWSELLQQRLQDALGLPEPWEAGTGVPAARPGPRADRTEPAAGDAGPDGRPAAIDDQEPAARRAGAADGGRPSTEAAPGAGDGTDPDLFGEEAAAGSDPPDRFELAIAARVRTRHGGGAGPWTTAPGREADRHPQLGARRRWEQPGHRMAVPPALAPLVQRLYAHPAPAAGGTP